MTSLQGKNKVEVKFENSMHNYNATLVHWHQTLGCQCSSFGTYDVHKVVPVKVLIAEKLNYFMTLLRGKNKVEVKFENSMHNYNATLVHWHQTLGCQCSSFGTYAVHKVGPIKQSRTLRTDGQTDGQTEIINLIVGLVTRNPPKNGLLNKAKLHVNMWWSFVNLFILCYFFYAIICKCKTHFCSISFRKSCSLPKCVLDWGFEMSLDSIKCFLIYIKSMFFLHIPCTVNVPREIQKCFLSILQKTRIHGLCQVIVMSKLTSCHWRLHLNESKEMQHEQMVNY